MYRPQLNLKERYNELEYFSLDHNNVFCLELDLGNDQTIL